MNTLIQADNLSKKFGRQTVLDNLSFSISEGKIIGLLGNNGAGKKTLMKTCMGLYRACSGTLQVLEKDPLTHRHEMCRDVTFIPDTTALDPWMKAGDLLKFMEGVHPNWNTEKSKALFAKSDLPLDQKIETYSKGMKVKLYLLMTLSIDSRLMILDEPTLGLDIPFRKAFLNTLMSRSYFSELNEAGRTSRVPELSDIFMAYTEGGLQ